MRIWIGVWLAFVSMGAVGATIVTQGKVTCEEYPLNQDLPVFKDPEPFLQALRDRPLGSDPFLTESPLLTTVRGKVKFMKLWPAQPSSSFAELARWFGFKEHRSSKQRPPLVVPILFCGDTYSDSLGYIFVEDLNKALKARREAKVGLPPSTYPNPIPDWKKGG